MGNAPDSVGDLVLGAVELSGEAKCKKPKGTFWFFWKFALKSEILVSNICTPFPDMAAELVHTIR